MLSPGLHPSGGPRPTTSRAEQALHRALASRLPEGWSAWHSLRIRTGKQLEGEGDFVIAIPDRGILIIEVKGGAIEVARGMWLQNGKPMDQPPRTQALGYKSKLLEKLGELLPRGVPWIAVATAFPDTAYSRGPSQGDLDGAVLGQQDLPYLCEALVEIAQRLFEGTRPPRDTDFIEALHTLWCETWKPRLSLGRRARVREQELVALDRDQLDLLDQVDDNPRVVIYGGPGTGKTLLAREMVDRLTARSRRPVFLCSTSALASGLRADGMPEAWTVREFAARLLEQAGVVMQGGAALAAWTSETWELAPLQAVLDALPVLGLAFDAVVVDEGQDLAPNDWELVKAVASSNPLWCFADKGQGFWTERGVPPDLGLSTFRLRARYRCPEPLAVFADQYRPADGETKPPVGPFDELRIVKAPSPTAVADKVALEVAKALGEGAAPSDIAVLSLAGQTRTKLCAGDRVGAHRVVRADAADADTNVIADTFLRFKGLERPWIIVSELSLGESRHDVRMHVALTRATVGCVVVGTAEEIAADPRLMSVTA